VDPGTTQREDSRLKQKTKTNKKIRRQAVPRATRGDTTPTYKKFHETFNETKTSYIQQMTIRRLHAITLVAVKSRDQDTLPLVTLVS
jgi:hypothetical protein